jgi:DNA-directed RNA polymerase subunit RPC12/RpoP
MQAFGAFLVIVLFTSIFAAVLLFPTIVAFVRNHPERWSIFALNFSVGGSNLGWGAALAWALRNYGNEPTEIESIEEKSLQECPYCAETIKAKAQVCRYCGNKLMKQQSA